MGLVQQSNAEAERGPTNGQIADQLTGLAQLLYLRRADFYRAKAYQRAAEKLRNRPESLSAMIREGEDLTRFSGVGDVIANAIREYVLTGRIALLDKMRSESSPELAAFTSHPRLDPRRILRIYKKFKISSVESLKEHLETGAIEEAFGPRMAQHVRQGLGESHAMLLYRADEVRAMIEGFLLDQCGVRRTAAIGDYRRRTEVIDELAFLVETDHFPTVVSKLKEYGGGSSLLHSGKDEARFVLPSGIPLRIQQALPDCWGFALVKGTGSNSHLHRLTESSGIDFSGPTLPVATEERFYERLGLDFIEPELREGRDEVDRAREHRLPELITAEDLRGELHAHSLSSDGASSIEAMAVAARDHGYEYIGITDHSQSLKIANGVPEEELWHQIRFIDRLNEDLQGIRVLKSSEVDILADGSLDYSDALLKELDYTICSIHSRFNLGKEEQTQRILRAMDNRYFNILGHATGRLLLKRPGYEIDIERILRHAKESGCFFEINSSPDRLDLSWESARLAKEMDIPIAITTDAHHTREFRLSRCGIDQARKAGIEKHLVLNCAPWQVLRKRLIRN